jgi:hypothetical protein
MLIENFLRRFKAIGPKGCSPEPNEKKSPKISKVLPPWVTATRPWPKDSGGFFAVVGPKIT